MVFILPKLDDYMLPHVSTSTKTSIEATKVFELYEKNMNPIWISYVQRVETSTYLM